MFRGVGVILQFSRYAKYQVSLLVVAFRKRILPTSLQARDH